MGVLFPTDCRAGLLTLSNSEEVALDASSPSRDISSPSCHSKDPSNKQTLFNPSATPIVVEEIVPPFEFHRPIIGDLDVPPSAPCEDFNEVLSSNSVSDFIPQESFTYVRQKTKLTDFQQKPPVETHDVLRVVSHEGGVSTPSSSSSSSSLQQRPFILNLGDNLANQLLSATNRKRRDDGTSNESMVVGTPISTPLSLTLSDATTGIEHLPPASNANALKDEDLLVLDLKMTDKEKKEKAMNLESAITNALHNFSLGQKIPYQHLSKKTAGVSISSHKVGRSAESGSDPSNCGTTPILSFQWLNVQHRLSNPEELRRVKALGGKLGIKIDCGQMWRQWASIENLLYQW